MVLIFLPQFIHFFMIVFPNNLLIFFNHIDIINYYINLSVSTIPLNTILEKMIARNSMNPDLEFNAYIAIILAIMAIAAFMKGEIAFMAMLLVCSSYNIVLESYYQRRRILLA